ncbi:MAG: VWA domain-containing protein [bacterium]|nr:VWA domain-containing protein [bacterium]
MLQFEYLWMFLLLPALFLLRRILPVYQEQREAVQAPFFDKLVELTGQTPSKGAVVLRPSPLQKGLLLVGWVLVVTALARPQWVEDPIVKIQSARDLMIAVDLSGSMEAEDFTDKQGNRINRLDAVKLVLDDFIARREGDRLGLILFGNAAFLQVPFTQDYDTFRILLDEAQVRMAGPQTMLGDAIGLSIKLFEESDVENRVLILLTDGNDTGSKVPPPKAAEIAAQKDITMYTVAIGDPETVGEDKLDIEALQNIADMTGGSFFHANNREELETIYEQLDKLEPEEFESLSYRPKRPLFHWPLGIFLIVSVLYHAVNALKSFRKTQHRV